MSNLDPRIEAVRKQYDLQRDDFWQIPQNKQWVAKHSALEIVAHKAGVNFAAPQIIEANTSEGIAVLAVSGEMNGRIEWATGEASPKNCKNAYPWAMAEKRAKDRVVLKLAGIHGLVYSEEEADDFKESSRGRDEPRQQQSALANDHQQTQTQSSSQLKKNGEWERVSKEIADAMLDVNTFGQFEELKASYREEAKKNGWNKAFTASLADLFLGYEDDLQKKIEAENTTEDSIKTQFPGARTVDERVQAHR